MKCHEICSTRSVQMLLVPQHGSCLTLTLLPSVHKPPYNVKHMNNNTLDLPVPGIQKTSKASSDNHYPVSAGSMHLVRLHSVVTTTTSICLILNLLRKLSHAGEESVHRQFIHM